MNTNENARPAGTGRALKSAVANGLRGNDTTVGFLSAALELAAAGVPVFPCKPDKSPYIAGGFKAATTDAATIRRWADTFPDALVGVPTGEASGLFVLDIDRHGDVDGFAALAALGFEVPRTQMHSTPNGGAHYLFRWRDGLGSSAGKIGQGIDTRGTGGYVIWWPQNGHHAENVGEIAAPPVWLIDALSRKPQEAAGAAPTCLLHAPDRYAQAALERAAGAVMAAPEGARNDTLNREAHGLFGLALAGRLDAATVGESLTRAALAAGLDQVEIARTIQSAREAAHPRHADHREASASRAPEAAPAQASTDAESEISAHACTDLANAHRIRDHYGDRLLFVSGIGWHVWRDGVGPWRLDDLAARRIVHGLGKIIANEAASMAEWVAAATDAVELGRRQKAMNARFAWARQSESSARIEAAMHMAASLLNARADALDSNPSLLGTPGGVLELESGRFRPHRQNDRITKTTSCDFNPNAAAPTWGKFIASTFAGDAELSDFVQRLAGYALSGSRGDHVLPILFGSGANGKSTFLSAMQFVLGDYASTAAPGLLMTRNGEQHPTEYADLHGRRLVIASESGEAGRLNEELVKRLTGGDRIKARRMKQDFFEFDPSHLLILQTNHKPRVTGTDEGVWRRLRLIPFTVTVPENKRDPRLSDKLRAEASGILAWAFQGYRRYQEIGLRAPAAVTAATADYRSASDQVGAFLSEHCIIDPTATATAADLYRAYADWCEANGERARPQRDFGTRLAERGFEAGKGAGGVRRWRGLSLSGASGASGPSFRLTSNRNDSTYIQPEIHATSATSATDDDAFQRAMAGVLARSAS